MGRLVMLAHPEGKPLFIRAEGEDAAQAIEELVRTVEEFSSLLLSDRELMRARERASFDFHFAIFELDVAIELKPDVSNNYFKRGGLYFEIGEYEKAVVDYGKAIQLNPDFGAAYYGLGDSYLRLKDYPRALDSLREAARLLPPDDERKALALAHIPVLEKRANEPIS
jgi:tetratricopeptide (TPR) repeat protein